MKFAVRPATLAALGLLAALTASCTFGTRTQSVSTLDEIVQRGTLRAGMNSGYKPFETKNAKGGWEGFDVDLARHLAEQMGVKLEIVETEWDPVIPNLQAGKFDFIISGMTRTPRRALGCAFTTPYFKTGQVIMVCSAKHPPGSIQSPESLNRPDIVLSTRLGTTGEVAARKQFPKAQIHTFDGEGEAALEVDAGRADAMVYDQPFLLLHTSEADGKTWVMPHTLTSEFLAIAVRRGDQEFLNWLNLTLDEFKRSPQYATNYKHWFGRDPEALDF